MASVAEIFKSMEYGPAPEADQQARHWLGKYEKVFGHFINGEWTEPGKTFDVMNPATREQLARVTQGTKDDVNAAVAAARAALPAWQGLDGHARARHLYALARGVQKHARLFAVLESMDNGKSIRETRDIDIPRRGISITTPGGRSCWSRSSPATRASASSDRSFRGTSRCSCWRGRWHPRSRPDAPSCSSRRSSRR